MKEAYDSFVVLSRFQFVFVISLGKNCPSAPKPQSSVSIQLLLYGPENAGFLILLHCAGSLAIFHLRRLSCW